MSHAQGRVEPLDPARPQGRARPGRRSAASRRRRRQRLPDGAEGQRVARSSYASNQRGEVARERPATSGPTRATRGSSKRRARRTKVSTVTVTSELTKATYGVRTPASPALRAPAGPRLTSSATSRRAALDDRREGGRVERGVVDDQAPHATAQCGDRSGSCSSGPGRTLSRPGGTGAPSTGRRCSRPGSGGEQPLASSWTTTVSALPSTGDDRPGALGQRIARSGEPPTSSRPPSRAAHVVDEPDRAGRQRPVVTRGSHRRRARPCRSRPHPPGGAERDGGGDLAGSLPRISGWPHRRAIEPAEIAAAIAFCASPAGGVVNGTVVHADGGFPA